VSEVLAENYTGTFCMNISVCFTGCHWDRDGGDGGFIVQGLAHCFAILFQPQLAEIWQFIFLSLRLTSLSAMWQ